MFPIKTEDRLDSLVFLRGVAVMMVCAFHFGSGLLADPMFGDLFKWLGSYGKYGVQMFFVISGFVIPWSFLKGSYTIKNYSRFLYKRLLRLHPPYLAALMLTFMVGYLSYRTHNSDFPESYLSILKSIFYLHIPKNNIVFWTLIVEIQFYFFIGLFYPFLMANYKSALFIIIPVLLIASTLKQPTFVSLFNYIIFFLLGIFSFLIYAGKKNLVINILSMILLIAFAVWRYELAAVFASLVAMLVIVFARFSIPRLLLFPGTISYSVYLIHYPIGLELISFFKPTVSPSYYWVIFLSAMVIVMAVGWLFYIVFEKYSEYFSRKIKYGANKML